MSWSNTPLPEGILWFNLGTFQGELFYVPDGKFCTITHK